MFFFGLLAFLLGAAGLIAPEILLRVLGFEILSREARLSGDYTLVFPIASSMASFNMGIYYMLAAFNELRPFYLWTVPFRLVTFTVFTLAVWRGLAPARFIGVAAWEGMGAILTGLALWYDKKKQKG
uniref:Hypothetical conserved protein n=1 Tax=uncultured Chloroflexota bacterium TaxID=166587 RepID=H5SQ51_9CHLR|nr:hypothetical conserved protein [uncultured Chloroflexota bacterium]